MNKRTQKALKQSIAHWRRMAKYTSLAQFKDEGLGVTSCALCTLFYGAECEGCPVYKETGEAGCDNSPYHIAETAYHDLSCTRGLEYWTYWEECAQDEVDFLKSLLPRSKSQ